MTTTRCFPYFADIGAAIVATLDPQPGCRFLDLGAGRGALTGPAVDRGCVVTSIDAAPAMVERLAASYPTVTALVMDAQALALPPDCFDVVAAAFVIHILDDPPAGVAEAYRVLAPGGRFALTGASAHSNAAAPAEASLGSRLIALFTEFGVYLPPGGGMGQPVNTALVLQRAGFVDLRQHRAEVTIRIPDNATLWRWMMSHGYRAFIEDLPAARRRPRQFTCLTSGAPLYPLR